MQRAYQHSTRVFGIVICGIGVALMIATVARGGGPLAVGVIVGAAFVALGAGRLYLAGGR